MGSACNSSPIVENRKNSRRVTHVHHYDIRERYTFSTIINKGSYGNVREYRDKLYPEILYAIKTITKINMSKAIYHLSKQEIELMGQTDHPNIVNYFSSFEDENYIHIVMEYLTGENLRSLLYKNNHLRFTTIASKRIIYQVLSALSYMHNHKIAHRDIKMDNVIFCQDQDKGIYFLKLIDFGFATKSPNKHDKVVGSPVYMSPETINGNFSLKSDVWSTGIMLYFLLFDSFPFKGRTNMDLFNHIIYDDINWDEKRKILKDDIGLDLLQKMLEKKEGDRISSFNALNHPWFKDMLKNNTEIKEVLNDFFNKKTLELTKKYINCNILKKVGLLFYSKFHQWDKIYKYIYTYIGLNFNICGNKGLVIRNIYDEFVKRKIINPKDFSIEELYPLDVENRNEERVISYSCMLSIFLNENLTIPKDLFAIMFIHFCSLKEKEEPDPYTKVITKETLLNSIRKYQYPFDNEELINEFFASRHPEITLEDFIKIIME